MFPASSSKNSRQVAKERPPEPPKYADLANAINRKTTNACEMKIEEEIKKLEHKLEEYLRCPDSHPLYKNEWHLFWNRKAEKLTSRGENPTDFDFKEEWCDFFIGRIHELHDEEVKFKKEQISREFKVTDGIYRPVEKTKPALSEIKSEFPSDPSVSVTIFKSPVKSTASRLEKLDKSFAAMTPNIAQNEHLKTKSMLKRRMSLHERFLSYDCLQSTQKRQGPIIDNDEFVPLKKIKTIQSATENELTNKFVPLALEPHKHVESKSSKHSRFDQPCKKFTKSNQDHAKKEPSEAITKRRMSLHERFESISNHQPKPKPTRNSNKELKYSKQTIMLENVPLSMNISEILDFFGGKLRGIVGCFRVADYIAKAMSRIVYLIIMDQEEIDYMLKCQEIFMDGARVRISALKLFTGSAKIDRKSLSVNGPPQSMFLGNLEKRYSETTFYLRELAKFFEPKRSLTGIRMCHQSQDTRTYGFVTFLSKSSLDEFDRRDFKLYKNEIYCKRTDRVPLLFHIDYAHILKKDRVVWNEETRKYNLLNANI